jgi:hypothetical protein
LNALGWLLYLYLRFSYVVLGKKKWRFNQDK